MKALFSKYSLILPAIILLQAGLYAQEAIPPPTHLFSVNLGLKAPVRIAISPWDILYVTDAFQKRLVKYDTTGLFLGSVGTEGYPIAVAVSSNNQIVVSDNNSGSILKLNIAGHANNIYTECVYPSSAVFDSDDNLYLVDSKLKQIVVMDLSGKVIRTIGQGILTYPTGLAYDKKNNRILVAEHGGTKSATGEGLEARILVFDLQGNLLNSFGKFGHEDGRFSRIQGIAVDQWGRIYATDPYQAKVSVFDENGTFITRFGQYGQGPGQLNAPMDIAIDSRQRLWITSMNNGSLEVFAAGNLDTDIIPHESDLFQNYPNPFTAGTWIPFVLSNDETVEVNIYDMNGVIVRTINPGVLKKGYYQIPGRALYWDGTDANGNPLAGGTYYYELKLGDTRKVKRLIIVKI